MARVLVIDQEEQIREVLQTVLTRVGHSVSLADSGKAGCRLYAGQPFDVVVVDIIGQDADIINALMDMRGTFPRCKIISICGNAAGRYSNDPQALAIGLGADATIGKPFVLDDFLTMVEELADV